MLLLQIVSLVLVLALLGSLGVSVAAVVRRRWGWAAAGLACLAATWVLLSMMSTGRPAATSWKDGRFRVYATDMDFDATRLGYDHQPGLLVLVPEEVVAAGSDEKWIVAEQREAGTDGGRFYVIPKAELGAVVMGPLSEAEFQEEVVKKGLPGFRWRK